MPQSTIEFPGRSVGRTRPLHLGFAAADVRCPCGRIFRVEDEGYTYYRAAMDLSCACPDCGRAYQVRISVESREKGR